MAAGSVLAFWLRPVAWVTAPVILQAALLAWKGRPDGVRRSLWLLGWLALGLAIIGTVNRVWHGSAMDFRHGISGSFPLVHWALPGLVRCTVHPGRGVLSYAPIVLLALAMARRLAWSARILCYGVPLLLLLVAPAVLAPRRVARALLALGAVVNLPGVLVASRACPSYVERLIPPPGAVWSPAGGDRVSEVPLLTPFFGHAWLLANSLAPARLPAP